MLMLCYHLRYKMQKSILIEAGSNKKYLYAKRQLLKWVEPIYVRKKICMPYPPTWLLQDHPFEPFQEECGMYSIFCFDRSILLKFLHQCSLLSWSSLFFFLIICTWPLCSSLMYKSDCIICLFISVNIVSLAHSVLVSCKCSVLLPAVLLFL